MRRVLLFLGVAALTIAAVVVPEPDAPAEPDFPPVTIDPTGRSTAGLWYCVATTASSDRESYVVVGAVEQATATLTFPNPIPGEEADRSLVVVPGPGGAVLAVSEIALRGDAPSLVEFSTQEATAFSLTTSGQGVVSGQGCVAGLPKIWHLPGGRTQGGAETVVRLFNPFPEIAIVTVRVASELGAEPLTDLEAFTVPARSWRDISFGGGGGELRNRELLAVTVLDDEGLVLPTLLLREGGDEASWSGTALAREWVFPVVGVSGMTPSLEISNPGSGDATIEVDLLTVDGELPSARTAIASAGLPASIPLDDLVEGATGIRVRSDVPISAVAVARGGAGVAGTQGVAEPAGRWMLPGPPPQIEGVGQLWFANTGEEASTVTVVPLGDPGAAAQKLRVEPGTVRQAIMEGGPAAYLVEATAPVSAAWSFQSEVGTAFLTGRAFAG